MKKRRLNSAMGFGLFGAAAILAGWGQWAAAAVQYNYIGDNYTTIENPASGLTNDLTGTYTTAQSVTGFFRLNSALGANFSGAVTGLAGFTYQFNDGRATYTPTAEGMFAGTAVFNNGFQITTDATGVITDWEIMAGYAPPGAYNGIMTGGFSIKNATGDEVNLSSLNCPETPNLACIAGDAASVATPGSWTVEQVNGNAPEPATLALFSLGLAGLGAVRRKRPAA